MKSDLTTADYAVREGLVEALAILGAYSGPTAVLIAMGFMSGLTGPLLAIGWGWYMAGTLEQRLINREAHGLRALRLHEKRTHKD